MLLSILLMGNNALCLSQTHDFNNLKCQREDIKQLSLDVDLIKADIADSDFKLAKSHFAKLIKKAESSSIPQSMLQYYFNALNEIGKQYCYFQKDVSKKQNTVLEIKSIYKEIYSKNPKFQDNYINSIRLYMDVNPHSNTELYGALEIIDIYLKQIKSNDYSQSQELFNVYQTYNMLLITNNTFKELIYNRLRETVSIYENLAEKDLPTKNTRYLPYLSMSLCYIGNFYAYNTTLNDAKKFYYHAFDVSKILTPNSPSFYEQLYVLDYSFYLIWRRYSDLGLPSNSEESDLKLWDYYYSLLKINYFKIVELPNFSFLVGKVSDYYYEHEQYEKFIDLYRILKTLSDDTTKNYQMPSKVDYVYNQLVRQDKIKPLKNNQLNPNDKLSLPINEICLENAIKYEKEADGVYSNRKKALPLYKKADYIYSKLEEIKPNDPMVLKKHVELLYKMTNSINLDNDKEYLYCLLRATTLLEKLKILSSKGLCDSESYSLLPATYMDIGIYYYQRGKDNKTAEKYFDKAVNNFEIAISKINSEDKADRSVLLLYRNVCNFYAEINNYQKIALYRARMIEIFKKYVYSKDPTEENAVELINLNYLYAQALFNIRQYNKAESVLVANIKTINNSQPSAEKSFQSYLIANTELLGNVYFYKSDFFKAEQCLVKYITLKENSSIPKNVYYYKDFLKVYKKLIFIYQRTGQKTKERQAVNKIKMLNEQVLKLQVM